MFLFKLHEKPYYYLLKIYMKKLCSHELRSHLAIKKFEKFKFKKLRNLRFISLYLHCISFFGTVFQKNCTAPKSIRIN
jgi:hypothetical protein